jgi:hypothetical protein
MQLTLRGNTGGGENKGHGGDGYLLSLAAPLGFRRRVANVLFTTNAHARAPSAEHAAILSCGLAIGIVLYLGLIIRVGGILVLENGELAPQGIGTEETTTGGHDPIRRLRDSARAWKE